MTMRTESAGKRGGGKLSRSETVTVRLDPKLNYLCELAARAQRRTKSSFIEWAVAESLTSVSLPDVGTSANWSGESSSIADHSMSLWHVDEPDRIVSLALIAPALLTHEEQLIWRIVRENGSFWRGRFNPEWTWLLDERSLNREALRQNWEVVKGVAFGERDSSELPTWIKSKSSSTFPKDLDDEVPF